MNPQATFPVSSNNFRTLTPLSSTRALPPTSVPSVANIALPLLFTQAKNQCQNPVETIQPRQPSALAAHHETTSGFSPTLQHLEKRFLAFPYRQYHLNKLKLKTHLILLKDTRLDSVSQEEIQLLVNLAFRKFMFIYHLCTFFPHQKSLQDSLYLLQWFHKRSPALQ